jgi:general secretion pathway protein I
MAKLRGARASQAGFTLLEVLVAMMILGLSLGAILQQFALASRAGSASADATRATVLAREKIEELKMQRELSESVGRGSFDDGFEWETSVEFYGYDGIEDPVFEDMNYETYRLSAVVTWRVGNRSKQVELVTLRTMPKKEWTD